MCKDAAGRRDTWRRASASWLRDRRTLSCACCWRRSWRWPMRWPVRQIPRPRGRRRLARVLRLDLLPVRPDPEHGLWRHLHGPVFSATCTCTSPRSWPRPSAGRRQPSTPSTMCSWACPPAAGNAIARRHLKSGAQALAFVALLFTVEIVMGAANKAPLGRLRVFDGLGGASCAPCPAGGSRPCFLVCLGIETHPIGGHRASFTAPRLCGPVAEGGPRAARLHSLLWGCLGLLAGLAAYFLIHPVAPWTILPICRPSSPVPRTGTPFRRMSWRPGTTGSRL